MTDERNTFLIHVLQRADHPAEPGRQPRRTVVAMVRMPQLTGDPKITTYPEVEPTEDAPPVWFVRDWVLDKPIFYFVPAPEGAPLLAASGIKAHVSRYVQGRTYAEPDDPQQYRAVMGENAFYGAMPIFDRLVQVSPARPRSAQGR